MTDEDSRSAGEIAGDLEREIGAWGDRVGPHVVEECRRVVDGWRNDEPTVTTEELRRTEAALRQELRERTDEAAARDPWALVIQVEGGSPLHWTYDETTAQDIARTLRAGINVTLHATASNGEPTTRRILAADVARVEVYREER